MGLCEMFVIIKKLFQLCKTEKLLNVTKRKFFIFDFGILTISVGILRCVKYLFCVISLAILLPCVIEFPFLAACEIWPESDNSQFVTVDSVIDYDLGRFFLPVCMGADSQKPLVFNERGSELGGGPVKFLLFQDGRTGSSGKPCSNDCTNKSRDNAGNCSDNSDLFRAHDEYPSWLAYYLIALPLLIFIGGVVGIKFYFRFLDPYLFDT